MTCPRCGAPADRGRPLPSGLITVSVWQRIYSGVPGRAGQWSISKTMRLAAVPRAGDQVCLAEGWACETVDRVTFSDGGDVEVVFSMTTDSPDRLDEMARLVADHGWEQLGGPWFSQS
jgi:hypothetical protein